MNKLIESIEKFNVSKNEDNFNKDLDDVIELFDKQEIFDTEYEWEILCSNYSRLRYIQNIIKYYHIPETEKFLLSIEKFMKKIDKISERYLEKINWDDSDYKESFKIKELLEKSLLEKDSILKIKTTLWAYDLLLYIAEDCRGEHYKESIDKEFLEEFSYKRTKLN
jgi:hypothetical protein